jgi:hypothetical protein
VLQIEFVLDRVTEASFGGIAGLGPSLVSDPKLNVACELQHPAQIKANLEWISKMRQEWKHNQAMEEFSDSACSGLRALP